MRRIISARTIIYWTQISCVAGGLILVLLWGLDQEIAYKMYSISLIVIFIAAEFYRRYLGSDNKATTL